MKTIVSLEIKTNHIPTLNKYFKKLPSAEFVFVKVALVLHSTVGYLKVKKV